MAGCFEESLKESTQTCEVIGAVGSGLIIGRSKEDYIWIFNFAIVLFCLLCCLLHQVSNEYSATSIIRTPLSTGLIMTTYQISEIVQITEVPTFLA